MSTKTFPGGVYPRAAKEHTKNKNISYAPIPKKAVIPLLQNTGDPAKPVVSVGEDVSKGQLIGRASGFISSNVHSSISGKVTAIDWVINPIYGRTEAVTIESDGKDTPFSFIRDQKSLDLLTPKDLIDIISSAGIVGLGGAAFPAHVKLITAEKNNIDSLIVNGAECEPYLTCDHRLMIEKSKEILEGISLINKIVKAKNVYIAIEENKQDAINTMKRALARCEMLDAGCEMRVIKLKTKYPQGGEKQLIKVILKREVPPEKLPLDVGCAVQNVGTVLAVYEAAYMGKPLIDRCVTLTGSCLKNPGNFIIRIGTLLSDVIEESSGGFIKECAKIILGGPMMGVSHFTLDIPIIKGITGVVFLSEEETEIREETPCIKCAKCVDICPLRLIPTEIARSVKRKNKANLEEFNVSDCIECGACGFACPAGIPLVQYMKLGKILVKG